MDVKNEQKYMGIIISYVQTQIGGYSNEWTLYIQVLRPKFTDLFSSSPFVVNDFCIIMHFLRHEIFALFGRFGANKCIKKEQLSSRAKLSPQNIIDLYSIINEIYLFTNKDIDVWNLNNPEWTADLQ